MINFQKIVVTKALKNSVKGLRNHDREFSALSASCKEEMNICAILHHTDNVFRCDLQYVKIKMVWRPLAFGPKIIQVKTLKLILALKFYYISKRCCLVQLSKSIEDKRSNEQGRLSRTTTLNR